MTLDEIIKAGDRVEFKKYIETCTAQELMTAQIKGAFIQDFSTLAHDAGTRRGIWAPIRRTSDV